MVCVISCGWLIAILGQLVSTQFMQSMIRCGVPLDVFGNDGTDVSISKPLRTRKRPARYMVES